MAIKEPDAPAVGGKGLQAGAIGLVGNVVIGLAAVAPAYSLAATLGYVVLAVGEKAPSMFVLAFIPMLLVAFAYKELAQDTPDCGTTFTWATKAFGPWIGWIGGWGLAVSAIIVLANVAEVAAIYLFYFLGLDDLAENIPAKVLLGSFFIIAMTLLSARGIVVSERVQNVLIAIQFGVLIIVSIIALIRVFAGTAGAQAISPQMSWLWPSGLDVSSIAQAIILCIFIYWGWDACLAVGEETKDPGRTPGIAAVITTLILVCTYVLVAYAVQSFSGFGDVGIGLNNAMNTDDVLTVLGEPVAGTLAASLLLLTVSVSATVVHPDDDPADRARNPLDGRLRGHPEAIRQRPPALHDARLRHDRDGLSPRCSSTWCCRSYRRTRSPTRSPRWGLRWRSTTASPRSRASGTSARPCSLRCETCSSAASSHCSAALRWQLAFGISAKDMIAPDYGYTAFGPIGGVFVLGVGMLVLGIPLMLACFAFGTKRFFRGETLNAATEVKVPDTF